jgi:hypothetical protein
MLPGVPRICLNPWLILLTNLVGLGLAARASAAEIVCGLAEKDLIVVDGMLDDWRGVEPARFGASSWSDAGVLVRCNYDADAVYLAFDVSDNQLVRRRGSDKGAEDELVLAFGGTRLELFPADGENRVAMRARWAGGKPTKGLSIADSLQPKGWSFELAIPKSRLPGFAKGVTQVPFELEFHDADLFSERAEQDVVTSGGGGALVLEEGAQLYKQMLEDLHIKPKDIWKDQMANMDGAPGMERVVVAGRTIAILGESYFYMQLPVPRKDILALRLVDLAGEGKTSIVVHYVERGNGGSREVLAVWNVMSDGSFSRPFSAEVAKESPAGRMSCRWTIEPKQTKKGRKVIKGKGQDIVVRVGDVRGFEQNSWNELPAEDMAPILLPWGEVKERRWHFRGDESYGDAD